MAWGAKESDHDSVENQISQEKLVEASYLLMSFNTHPHLCHSIYCSGMKKQWDFTVSWTFIKVCVKSSPWVKYEQEHHLSPKKYSIPCSKHIPSDPD